MPSGKWSLTALAISAATGLLSASFESRVAPSIGRPSVAGGNEIEGESHAEGGGIRHMRTIIQRRRCRAAIHVARKGSHSR